MKIFVSSTFEDLQDYRIAAIRVLRQMGHEVVAMEDFTASSAPPVERVLELVRSCQAYIGIFAWRYGYVPQQQDIPDKLFLPAAFAAGETSITHLEYLQAEADSKEILAFLLDEKVPWPPYKIDAFIGSGRQGVDASGPPTEKGKSIQELRQNLMRARIVSFFTSPSDLEARVATAVTNLGLTLQIATNLHRLTQPVPPVPDSSAHGPIKQEIERAQTNPQRTVTVDIAETWWATRLYLLTELASRFTDISRIVFIEGGNDFIGMLPVRTVLDRLVDVDKRLKSYSNKLHGDLERMRDRSSALGQALSLWDKEVNDVNECILVTAPNLAFWFGDALLRHPVEVQDLSKATLIDVLQILGYSSEFRETSYRRNDVGSFHSRRTQP